MAREISITTTHKEWAKQHLLGFETNPLTILYFSETPVTNFGLAHSEGDYAKAHGVRDWTDPHSPPLDRHTMCHEASVGKVRFSALAHLMQQAELIDLTANAYEFFQQPFVKLFFLRKYPGQDVHSELMKLFECDKHRQVRLVDFLSHTGGMGDIRVFKISQLGNRGIEHKHFTLPETLGLPWKTEDEIPKARGQFDTKGAGLFNKGNYDAPSRQGGVYQYSNIGYMLLSEALEAAYLEKHGVMKSYETLLKDFILDPKEGRAKGKIRFSETKFPFDLTAQDNAVKMMWFDSTKRKISDATRFNGHLAAVGPFSSSDDAAKFFREFFRGFPGTPEHGKNANVFFTDETITAMQKESERGFELIGTDMEKTQFLPSTMHPKPNHKYYGGPGFMVEKDDKGEIVSYHKSGVGWGLRRYIEFIPSTGQVNQTIRVQENVSGMIAQAAGITMDRLHKVYGNKFAKSESQDFHQTNFDRGQLLRDYQEQGISFIKEKVQRFEKLHPHGFIPSRL
jgi:CubicO group peptidase (beta-lactamase class C family)